VKKIQKWLRKIQKMLIISSRMCKSRLMISSCRRISCKRKIVAIINMK